MKTLHAIRWALYERFLSLVWLLVGLGIAAGGIWLGAGDVLLGTIYGDASIDSARSLPLAAGALVVGLFVWQLGSTAASLKTIAGVTGTMDEDQVDRMQTVLVATLEDRLDELAATSSSGEYDDFTGRDETGDRTAGGERDELTETSGHSDRERASYGTTEVDSGGDGDVAETPGGTDPNAAFESD